LVIRDDAQVDEAVQAITAVLRERHNLGKGSEDDFMVITPEFVKQKIGEMTRIFNVFLPLISLVALVASCIVIVVLMLISVNERIAEIGLRKATGARYKDILFQFTSEAAITSLLGGIIGIILGLAAFSLVSLKMKVPFEPSFLIFAGGFILPVLTGVISGILPARRAAAFNPVEALR
jgi:putative ABC transport system permease protein